MGCLWYHYCKSSGGICNEYKRFVVNFLGDSITFGVGVSDLQNGRYDHRIAKMLEPAKINNYSVNGSRLAHQSFPSAKPWYDLCFCGRAYEMDANADMVIVFGGVNDYIHGDAPFGEAGDTTPATFCGGVYYLMNYLREIYGDKPIIFMTPARCFLRHEVDDLYPSVHAAKRVPGKPLKAYADVISETAKQFDIRVLDLYNNLGIDPHIPEQFEKYTTDGLHLNDEGHALLAQKLKELIESM